MERPDYILGQFGSKVIFLLSPAIAQTTRVNKSVSFARWQQGAGFVVSRTTACYTGSAPCLPPVLHFSSMSSFSHSRHLFYTHCRITTFWASCEALLGFVVGPRPVLVPLKLAGRRYQTG